jgi:hypothetical protein
MQAGNVRLADRRDQIPREKLSAVRVPGDHQVESEGLRRIERSRLMREENSHGIGRSVFDRRPGIGFVVRQESSAGEIGHARQRERPAASVNQPVLVQEHIPEPRALRPGLAWVVFVVSSDENFRASLQFEGSYIVAQVRNARPPDRR